MMVMSNCWCLHKVTDSYSKTCDLERMKIAHQIYAFSLQSVVNCQLTPLSLAVLYDITYCWNVLHAVPCIYPFRLM